jgi:cell division protein FtsA
MADHQILAALQIESGEVRLLVGEYLNSRINVLYRDAVPCKGLNGIRIVDQAAVVAAVKKAVGQAGAHLGTPVKSVLLAIPAYRYSNQTRSFSKVNGSPDGKVSLQDIRDIYQKGLAVAVGGDLVTVNVACTSYRINGITYPQIPLGEKFDVMDAEVDLLCCDKMTTYDYAEVVEKAGLKIIDVCLDNYALAKEAALLIQTGKNYLLTVQLEKQHTLFSLIYNNKIVSAENDPEGYADLAKPIHDRYGLPERNSVKLLLKYAQLDKKDFNDRPIYSWSMNGVSSTMTDRELYNVVSPAAQNLTLSYRTLCGPILAQENVTVLLCGEGANIAGMDRLLADSFNRPVRCYYPDTLGAREAKWAVDLGQIYSYADLTGIHPSETSSIDIDAFLETIRSRSEKHPHEDGLTARLKDMLYGR